MANGDTTTPVPSHARGSWPTRRTLTWLTAALVLFAAYLSLVPFDFQSLPLREAAFRFAEAFANPPLRPPRADFAANLVFFVFVGVSFSAMLALDRDRWTQAGLALAAVAGVLCVSLTLEFAQVFFPVRVVSAWDVAGATMGGAVGAALWILAGQVFVEWIRMSAAGREHSSGLVKLLVIYAAGFVLAGLIPFDVTFDIGQLAHKYRSGRIVIVPFGAARSAGATVWHAVWTVAAASPLGMLAALGWTRRESRHRLAAAIAAGAACVVAIEFAQVFIPSRFADVTDALIGSMGAAAGAAAALGWAGASRRSAPGESASRQSNRQPLTFAIVGWALLVVAYHWYPFDFVHRTAFVKARLRGLSLVPLVGYYNSPPFTAFDQFLTKLALGAPLGVMIQARVRRPGGGLGRLRTVAVAVAALGFFFAVEAGQVFLPTRVPDTGDALVGAAGLMLGLLLALRFGAQRS